MLTAPQCRSAMKMQCVKCSLCGAKCQVHTAANGYLTRHASAARSTGRGNAMLTDSIASLASFGTHALLNSWHHGPVVGVQLGHVSSPRADSKAPCTRTLRRSRGPLGHAPRGRRAITLVLHLPRAAVTYWMMRAVSTLLINCKSRHALHVEQRSPAAKLDAARPGVIQHAAATQTYT
jgi:hypothetical protein